MSFWEREAEGLDRIREAGRRGSMLRLRVVVSFLAWAIPMFVAMEQNPGELVSFVPMAGFILGVLPIAAFPVWAALQVLLFAWIAWESPVTLWNMGYLAWLFLALYLLLNVALYLQQRAERATE